MRFVFWQPMLNRHEAGYISALASRGYDCTVVFQDELSAERRRLGFQLPDYGLAKIVECNVGDCLPECVVYSTDEDFHFLTGVRAFNLTRRAFAALEKSQAKLFVISESRKDNLFFGLLRWFDSVLFERKIRRRVNGVLTMGMLGVSWFERTFYPPEKIFEFCYSVNLKDDESAHPDDFMENDDCFNIVFVGQLIRRKRVDLLINAVGKIADKRIFVHICGTGEEEAKLKSMLPSSLVENFVFHGPVDNDKVLTVVRNSDLLVLPSDWDGWGAVVNEALGAGTPVIASNRCGAAAVIANGCGSVFPYGNEEALAKAIRKQFSLGRVTCARRDFVKRQGRLLSGPSMSSYIVSIIDFVRFGKVRPLAPWRIADITEIIETPILIAYDFFPHYREGVLKAFGKVFANMTLAGDVTGINGIKPLDSSFFRFINSKCYRVLGLTIQPRVALLALAGDFDVYVFLANPNFLTTWFAALVLRIRNKKVIFWGHGFYSSQRSLKNLIRKLFFCLANSHYLYGNFARANAVDMGFEPRRLFVGYNSLDYERQLIIRNRLLSELSNVFQDSDARRINIVCVARVERKCMYDLLIEAAALLKEKSSLDVSILFIGGGRDTERIRSLSADRLVDSVFLGPCYDEELIARHVFSADVMVMPGNIGLTAMHALMYGTPVVTHGNQSQQMPEYEAIVDGFNGVLFRQGEAADLAEAIYTSRFSLGDRSDLRRNCFKRIDDLYNPSNQTQVMANAVISG